MFFLIVDKFIIIHKKNFNFRQINNCLFKKIMKNIDQTNINIL